MDLWGERERARGGVSKCSHSVHLQRVLRGLGGGMECTKIRDIETKF